MSAPAGPTVAEQLARLESVPRHDGDLSGVTRSRLNLQAARIAELEAEKARLRLALSGAIHVGEVEIKRAVAAEKERDALAARAQALTGAGAQFSLFADACDFLNLDDKQQLRSLFLTKEGIVTVTAGDFRKLRAALKPSGGA